MKKDSYSIPLLISVLLFTTFYSCGDAQKPESAVPDPAAETDAKTITTEEIQEIPIDSIGALSELDFGGYTLNIDISVNSQEWNTSSVYVMGENEECGDIAKDAVYRRNHDIEEALNLKVNWIPTDLGLGEVRYHIQKPIQAGDSGVDLYINDLSGQVPNMINGCYSNVYDFASEDSYFDFSDEGWLNEFMDQSSFIRTRRYFLASDFFLDTIRSAHAIFFSKTVLASYYDSPDELYNLVDSGKWTFDVLLNYVKGMYQDLNGNGQRDENDFYGMMFDRAWCALYFTTTGCNTVSWDEEGMPYVNPSIERDTRLADVLIKLDQCAGTFATDSHYKARTAFTAGNSLMIHWSKIADMEADELRNMDGIGVIPYPKLDEAQEKYLSMSHDCVEIGTIPVTIPEDSIAPLTAYLQAQTVYSHRHIIPAYYEIALKVKYTQDEQSAKMLDYIRDGISAPFEYAYRDYTSSIGYNAVSGCLSAGSITISSSVDKYLSNSEKKISKALNTLLEIE